MSITGRLGIDASTCNEIDTRQAVHFETLKSSQVFAAVTEDSVLRCVIGCQPFEVT